MILTVPLLYYIKLHRHGQYRYCKRTEAEHIL